MPNYRRDRQPGGCYFFTVNLLERFPNDLLVKHIDILRTATKKVKTRMPFHIDAWVVLPDHMHCIWTLPTGDDKYATRWRLIKTHFVKNLPITERRSSVRQKRSERGSWQRQYWEHCIRDDNDYKNHMDYLHYNPTKHGYVTCIRDWPYSMFHRLLERGIFPSKVGNPGHR